MSFIREHETIRDSIKEYKAVGGQALIEGIMMKGPKGTAMSVRTPDGNIDTEMVDFKSIRDKHKFFNLPIIRGVIAFVESMIQGMKLMSLSAEKTLAEDTEPKEEGRSMGVLLAISSVLGIALSVFLFTWLPSLLFDGFNSHIAGNEAGEFRALFEGVMRMFLFVAYIALTSCMSDIKKVYQYHGAEHKTIFCYEHGKELTVENVRKEKRFHPRCGTSFIFVTIILSILISSIVSVIFPVLTQTRWIWILTKLLMMPLIMGIGFEFIQFAGKHPNKFTKLLSAPGLLMQRITTKEPTDDMIEVAIAAVKAALTGKTDNKKKLSKQEFVETHCRRCGPQRCEGIGTEWFAGCEYKDELNLSDRVTSIDEPHMTVKSTVQNESHGDFVKKGCKSLCDEHPDVVQDIINS